MYVTVFPMTFNETGVKKINILSDFNDRNAINYSKTITDTAQYKNHYPLPHQMRKSDGTGI